MDENRTDIPEDGELTGTKANVFANFNYVGVKESAAYVLNDVSNTFNIDSFKERFVWDLVHVDFTVQAVVNIIQSVWDILNDVIFATIVDNTRTRIGKFRPYLLGIQIPITLLSLVYWLIPFIFTGEKAQSETYIPKLIFYFAFLIIQETASTAISLAKGGYMSTITPNPNERVRLITLAELLSGYLGEDMPRYIFGVLYDLIINKAINLSLRGAFAGMGIGTGLISCALTMWFFMITKERVPQSIERPSVKAGLKAIFTNYPVLLMCLSDFLAGFAVSKGESNYFIDVFGSYSLITLANIPSSANGSISYAFVSPMRKKFSSKAIWVGADIYGDMCNLGYFLFGLIGKNYTKMIPMVCAVGVREFIYKFSYGANKVINADLWNEAMDYCEWKNGYRMEATTSVAKSLVLKIQSSVMSSVTSIIMKKIGYVQGLEIGTQSDSTKFWLFALCSAVPTITGALGIVPKFLWPINKATRKKMYEELAERRNELVNSANDETPDAAPAGV